MYQSNILLRRNKLVIAMGIALLGSAITGCSSDDIANNTIKLNGGLGGNADFAQGGNGGSFYISNDGTSGGIELLKTGSVVTSFTSPDLPNTVNLGSNPLEITTDTTLSSVSPVSYSRVADATGSFSEDQVYMDSNDVLRMSTNAGVADYAADGIVADNSFYRSNSVSNELFQAVGGDEVADLAPVGQLYRNNDLYIADGDIITPDTYYTGLSVAVDTTLTVADNDGCDANLRFDNDIDNNGTITAETNDCEMNLYSNDAFYNKGTITSAGSEATPNGGNLYVRGNQGLTNIGIIDASGYTSADGNGADGGEIYLSAYNFIVNSGELLATGGDGLNNAGNGGEVSTSSPTYAENSGVINANGGSSTGIDADQGSGGSGGNAYFDADIVLNIKSSSTITANGGNGTSGGSGGDIYFYTSDDDGPLVSAANLNANGGTGSTSNGGYGGSVGMGTDGGDLLNSGSHSSTGGDSLSDSSSGGSGGSIYFDTDYDDSDLGTGNISVSGSLDVSGGNANATGSGSGGTGGYIDFYNDIDDENTITDQKISLIGYSKLESNGGNGAEGGHAYDGGECCSSAGVYIYADSNYYDDGTIAASSITNNVPIESKGGDTVTTGTSYGSGGDGGEIDISTDYFSGTGSQDINVTNTASIDVSGGKGYDGTNEGVGGGYGGSVYLFGTASTANSGAITANGGAGGSIGAGAGEIDIQSDLQTASNTASLIAKGADGTTDGGNGGDIELYSEEVTNSGSLNVDAGNATDATASSGGNGGYIGLFTNSEVFGLTSNGSFSYKAGTGETDGTEGCAQANFISEGDCN